MSQEPEATSKEIKDMARMLLILLVGCVGCANTKYALDAGVTIVEARPSFNTTLKITWGD